MSEPSRYRRTRLGGIATVGAVSALLVMATPLSAQTLTEALAYAYNNNPQLLAQRAALRATDESVPQALSGWRPTVNFSAQGGYSRSGFTNPPGAPQTAFSSFTTRS